MLSEEEQRRWFQQIWSDVKGESTRNGHPAPFPVQLAYRLIRMFSFAGDTVLDPFLGTGSTTLAAMEADRNSIGVEIDPNYFERTRKRVIAESGNLRMTGAKYAEVKIIK